MHAKSDSDVTSLAPSSPISSPKIHIVMTTGANHHQLQTTPVYNSSMESPSHPSYGRHSRTSSASRFSGTFRSSSRRKIRNKRHNNDKCWPECNVIREEGGYNEFDYADNVSRRCQIFGGLVAFVFLFSVFLVAKFFIKPSYDMCPRTHVAHANVKCHSARLYLGPTETLGLHLAVPYQFTFFFFWYFIHL
ncbi:hypothetical protein MKW94_024552, partial [Papaver nudicaule]|nr:hypothetical protein [Papaver nudicaule]